MFAYVVNIPLWVIHHSGYNAEVLSPRPASATGIQPPPLLLPVFKIVVAGWLLNVGCIFGRNLFPTEKSVCRVLYILHI